MRPIAKFAVPAALGALLVCLIVYVPSLRRAGMDGTYREEGGHGSMEFKRNGTVYVTSFGGTFSREYELDGEHVLIKGVQGSQVLTKDGDRLLAGGPIGSTYIKQ
jgi:hypothetical protein